MSTAEAPADWLDSCWRCGSDRLVPSHDDYLLCLSCRRDVFGAAGSSAPAARAGGRLVWESRAMDCCWRCLGDAVDPRDELGLCASCRGELADDPR
jgi:hypothetical protein